VASSAREKKKPCFLLTESTVHFATLQWLRNGLWLAFYIWALTSCCSCEGGKTQQELTALLKFLKTPIWLSR